MIIWKSMAKSGAIMQIAPMPLNTPAVLSPFPFEITAVNHPHLYRTAGK